MGQGFSRMLQSISNEYLAPNQSPLKTAYNGFKDLESNNSGRSQHKFRPSSSDRSKALKLTDPFRKYAS